MFSLTQTKTCFLIIIIANIFQYNTFIGARYYGDKGALLWVDGSTVDADMFEYSSVEVKMFNDTHHFDVSTFNYSCDIREDNNLFTINFSIDNWFYYMCEFEFDVKTDDVQTTTGVRTDVKTATDVQTDVQTTTDIQTTTDVQTDAETTTDVQTTSSQTKHVTCTR